LIVIIHENFKFNRRLIRFIFCSIAIVVCILPWSLNINWPEFYRQGSLGNKSSIVLTDKIIFLIQSTGQTLTRLLIDFKSYGLLPYGIIAFITTVLILYAFLFPFIDKNIKDVKDIKVGLYLIFLTLPTPLAFALRDIFSTSGLRSDLNRYFIISYVGILLALTYLFYRKIKPLFITKLSPENISETENFISLQRLPLQRSIGNSKIYLMCFFLIISLETISSVTIVNEITWYNKVDSQIPEVSEIINQYSHPLIIMHPLHVERLAIFSLIRYFKKPLDFILINDGSQVAYIPPGYDAYFLFSPPFYGAPDYTIPELLKHFQFDLKELIVYDGIPLFKFEAAQP